MFEDDTSDADGVGGEANAPISTAPTPLGDTGWLAGDFKNGLGLLGMVPPPGHYRAPDAFRGTLFGLKPPSSGRGDSGGRQAAVGQSIGNLQNGPGLLGMPAPSSDDSGTLRPVANESGNSKKEQCLELCSHLALPSRDFGVRFQRCMHQCMGTNSYPEWEKHFDYAPLSSQSEPP
jgi:hypothetical protein